MHRRAEPPTRFGHLEVDRRVRDRATGRTGVVVEIACRYVHASAAPVYNYLIRWDDGVVAAIDENALLDRHGVVALD